MVRTEPEQKKHLKPREHHVIHEQIQPFNPSTKMRVSNANKTPTDSHQAIRSLAHGLATKTEKKALARTRALCKALKSNTTLMELDLSCERNQPSICEDTLNSTRGWLKQTDTSLGNKAMSALSEALQVNTTLTFLNLAGEQHVSKVRKKA